MRKVFGIDIGGTDIKLGIVDEKGVVLEGASIPTRGSEGIESAAVRVKEWLDGHGASAEGIDAAGVGCAGFIDAARGYLYVSPNLPVWENVELGRIFKGVLGMRVVIENDANCAAWGEYVLGAGMGKDPFICITLGTGIGGGIVIGGKIYHGWQGLAGELGHQTISSDGPECSCGRIGCLEAFANASSIVSRAAGMKHNGEEGVLTSAEVAAAALKGDRIAIDALAEAGRSLGVGLANIVHMLNPEVIAVGGGVAGAGDLILEPARESMKKRLIEQVLAEVKIVPTELGHRSTLLGAAMLALECFE
jgi:glucokinase